MNNLEIKVISRNPDQCETKHDICKEPQKNGGNGNPLRHIVEYTRAMDAAKLERVFAEPYIACFDGYNEGVGVLSNHPLRLSHLLSGARDGQVKIGDYQIRNVQKK
uniref:Uncharacterized protein n=1 Tax=Panagrolaimus davidi TaxID=227884 RepID=A0A914QMX0_9BILA